LLLIASPDDITAISICRQAEVLVAGPILAQLLDVLLVVVIVLSLYSHICSGCNKRKKQNGKTMSESEQEGKRVYFLLLSFHPVAAIHFAFPPRAPGLFCARISLFSAE
jgi:hypothetical protein